MSVRKLALAPAAGQLLERIGEYRDHILRSLADSGVEAATGYAGDLFWDPHCIGGIFPQSLPPLASGLPIVVTAHGIGPWSLPPREYFIDAQEAAGATEIALAQLHKWQNERWRIHRLIVSTRAAADEASRCLGLPSGRIAVIPPGIDQECFRPDGPALDASAGILCMVERLHGANIDRLLKAWFQLPEHDRAPLTLVVPGYQGPALPAGVRVIAEQLPAQVRSAYYRSALALVYPAFGAAGGDVIGEAMACGCPVAAPDLPALRELYADAYYDFNARSPNSIGAALREMIGSPGLRTELTAAGRERTRAFTWAASAASHFEVFTQACEELKSVPRRGNAVLVLGMHRGGTSATAGALEAAGVDFGSDPFPASADNPGGYHESRPIVQFDDALLAGLGSKWDAFGTVLDESSAAALNSLRPAARLALHRARGSQYLWGLKEPRMARLLPFWKPIIAEAAETMSAVIVVRHPEAVAASLAARDKMEVAQAMALWTDHMLAIERDTADMPRVVVRYEELVQNPAVVLARIGTLLGLTEFEPQAGADTVNRGWQHHEESAVAPVPGALDTVYEVWRCFAEEAATPGKRPEGFVFCHSAWEAARSPGSDLSTDYESWQCHQQLFHRIAVADSCAEPFTLHAVCIVPSGRESATMDTLASLRAQSDPAWQLTVVSAAAEPSHLDPRVTWVHASQPGIAEAAARLDTDSTRWVGFVNAGDCLHPHAVALLRRFLAERPDLRLVYTDEDQLDDNRGRVNPHFKPDLNLELLRSLPYLGGLLLVREDLVVELPWEADLPGAEDHDLALRVLDACGSEAIGHLPDVLYHRASGSYRCDVEVEEMVAAAGRALERHLDRQGIDACVQGGAFPASFRVQYPLPRIPKVSVLLPTRDQVQMLQRCLDTLLGVTDYPDLEVILLDNDTEEPEARRFLDGIRAAEVELEGRVKVIACPGAFNYSAMINRGAELASGEYLLLLNNDTAVLHPEWLREMMSHALQPNVGAVGARLLFPDGLVQHAGVILGTPADHPFEGQAGDSPGYFGRAQLAQDWSAVTAACLLVSARDFSAVGGFDAGELAVAFNDVDFCLKLGAAGKRLVYTPYAVLLHEGSKSQREGTEGLAAVQRRERYLREALTMYRRWLPRLASDPAYNPNLALRGQDFVPEPELPAPRYLGGVAAPRVICHPADRQGSGEYRVLGPARVLCESARAEVHVTERLPWHPADIERTAPDAVIFQRQIEDHQIVAMERYRRHSGAFCVFELDDLISNLPVKSAHHGGTPGRVMQRLRRALALCDRLVVSTNYLAETYGHLASEVVVRPNYLLRAMWGELGNERQSLTGRPRIGWAGGAGHAGDLALLVPVVEALADEVDWVFFGMCPEPLRRYAAELHPGVPLAAYPRALASLELDLAVAPLEDNPFNRGKSNLRLLEYGACGFPVLASNVEPYRCNLPVGLVGNRPREWVRAIRERLAEPQLLAKEGQLIKQVVAESWMLEDHSAELLGTWLPEVKVCAPGAVKEVAGNTSAIETRQVGHANA